MSNADKARTIVLEETVLNKYEGTPETGLLVETVYLTNGQITRHDFFNEDGEIIETKLGGIDAIN